MIDAEDIEVLKNLIVQSDNQHAFTRLYHIYFTPLLRFAVSFVRSPAIAEEIVSDVLLQLWRRRANAGEINNLTVYLFTCIRNQSLNHLDSRKAVATDAMDETLLEVAASQPDPEQAFISTETIERLEHAVNGLPERCRLIFRLVREEGLKYREVAELLNISPKTVEAQIGIAMRKLAETLRNPHTISSLAMLKVVS